MKLQLNVSNKVKPHVKQKKIGTATQNVFEDFEASWAPYPGHSVHPPTSPAGCTFLNVGGRGRGSRVPVPAARIPSVHRNSHRVRTPLKWILATMEPIDRSIPRTFHYTHTHKVLLFVSQRRPENGPKRATRGKRTPAERRGDAENYRVATMSVWRNNGWGSPLSAEGIVLVGNGSPVVIKYEGRYKRKIPASSIV